MSFARTLRYTPFQVNVVGQAFVIDAKWKRKGGPPGLAEYGKVREYDLPKHVAAAALKARYLPATGQLRVSAEPPKPKVRELANSWPANLLST